ncbi:hypothetical protein PR048_002391, partial [Dryococelus australis]
MSLTRHKWWRSIVKRKGRYPGGSQAKEFQIRSLREQLQQVDTGLRVLALQLKEEIREDGPTNHLKLCVLICLALFQLVGVVEYIFVMMDFFTKFVKLYLIKRATAHVVTEKVLYCYVLEVGQPKKIISDSGPQFRSDKWKTLTSLLGIELCFTAVYHPAANPVERVMRELGILFRMYCSEHHSHWAVIVNDVERVINRVQVLLPWNFYVWANPVQCFK